MSNLKKLMQRAAAGAAGGAALNVEEVFSTYLYEGNGSTQTITNDIDLSGEGGLVWLKGRNNGNSHYLHDSERTITNWLQSQTSAAEQTTGPVTSFNSNGFSLGYGQGLGGANSSGDTFASWTFRKAPKFFDVVTYTGTGSVQTISHNLGVEPGVIIVKSYSASGVWGVYHRSLGNTKKITLNETTAAETFSTYWNNTDPTSTEFTVGTNTSVNTNGNTYVAYLFAHNDGDGGFGPTGDQDIIKCGSYTEPASGTTNIDLGFEPQFLLLKTTSGVGSWQLVDTMRGITDNTYVRLEPNSSSAESTFSSGYIYPYSTGFTASSGFFGSGHEIIYIAIRRGPMAVPESATDVFNVQAYTGDGTNQLSLENGPLTDFGFFHHRDTANGPYSFTRLTGSERYLRSHSTSSEQGGFGWFFDTMNGMYLDGTASYINGSGANNVFWQWKRAPSYFDVVAYTGTGTNNHVINHNLGVAPEIILIKRRDAVNSWNFATQFTGSGYISGYVNSNSQFYSRTYGTSDVHYVQPTDTEFTVNNFSIVNASGGTYIAYLFASLDGVSKVGSYTGNAGASTINVDCGFSSGARFVLIKETSGTGDWWVFDTARGLVAGNDAALKLNTTDAETSADYIDPYSGGFSLQTNSGINTNGATFIFYAIA